MDVFVIPVGRDRYELYCESSLDGGESADAPATGVIGRMRERFWTMLKAAEYRQMHRHDGDEPKGWMGRMHERSLAWMVERIAEQRLLWNLRSATAATPTRRTNFS